MWVFKSRPRIYLNEVKTELKGLIIFFSRHGPPKANEVSHVSRLVKPERSNMTLSPQIRLGNLQSLGTWCFFQRKCD